MTERRLGVFICQCGGNISDYVDTEKLREAVEKEPRVMAAQVNMFTCSDAAQQNIVKEIQEKNLDGIVIASPAKAARVVQEMLEADAVLSY